MTSQARWVRTVAVGVALFAAAAAGCSHASSQPTPSSSAAPQHYVDSRDGLSFTYPPGWYAASYQSPITQSSNGLAVVSSLPLNDACLRGPGITPCARSGATTVTWAFVALFPRLSRTGRDARRIGGYRAEIVHSGPAQNGGCPSGQDTISGFIQPTRVGAYAMVACVPASDPAARRKVIAMLRSFRRPTPTPTKPTPATTAS